MRSLRDIPIKRKLTIITMLTTALGLALACGTFLAYEQSALKRDLVTDLASTAQVVGLSSASALSFDDPASAEQALQSLAAQPRVVAAAVYTRAGKVFATYRRPGLTSPWVPPPPVQGETFGEDALDVVRDIVHSGETIGAIRVRSDLEHIRRRVARSTGIFLLVTLGVGLIVYGVASRLQRVISDPVTHLAAVAMQVARENNYALRATKQGDDEIGGLIDGFNAMLAQIQARDVALQQAHDKLETRVAERSQALVREIAGRLRTEEERDGFFALSLDLLCITGREGSLKRVNAAFERLLGYSFDELSGPRFIDLVHPDDVPATMSRAKRVLAGRAVRDFENRVRHRDGTYRLISWSVTPVPGRDYFYACGRDVTALRRAQEQSAREKARFKFIFESVPVGIALVTPGEARSHLVNPAHERITGVSEEDSQIPGIFERVTDPEDYRRQMECAQPFLRGEVEHYSVEKRYLHPDGRAVWALLTSRFYREAATGQEQCVTSLIDITELKRAQEEVAAERARFKFIFESVPVGISLLVPGDSNSHVANPAHLRITGVSGERLLEPGVFERATHPDDYVRQLALVRRYKNGEIDRFTLEKRYVHADGAVVWASLERRMFTEPASGRKQSITTLIDITERKLAEARLAETHKQLLDISRQAGMAEVATGVLHNVGNVLNSVNVSATLIGDRLKQSKIANVARLSELLAEHAGDLGRFLTEDPKGSKIPAFVATLAAHLAREQADLLQEIAALRKNIEHIKDIVAMQQTYAKVCGVAERVAVADLVEDALHMVGGGAESADFAIVREFLARPSLTIEKHKVLQILVNLMRNAKHACEERQEGGGRMTIRVTSEDERVQIAVVDNGVGISAENLTRIFSHGFTTRRNGHGFGLHSGANAAKELGGALRVHSDGAGCGATFTLELPLQPEKSG